MANMATDSIVFYTAGVTDLQVLVLLDNGRTVRGVIDGGEVRAFHQALLDGRLPYQIVDDPALRDGPDSLKEYKFSIAVDPAQAGGFTLSPNESKAGVGEAQFDWTEKGAVRLFPAKLAAFHQMLKTSGDYRVLGAVGFSTHRDRRADEPIALGKILSTWLAGCLAPDMAAESSGWVDYLDKDMRSPGDGRDKPFNRLAAQRIETAIREAHESQPNAIALATLVGGLPGAKEVVLAALELHFKTVLQWQQAVGEPAQEVTTPPPQDALRARRIAQKFIQRGRFVEAAAVASEYLNDPFDGEWALPLRLTATLFIDNPLHKYGEHPPQGLPKDLAKLAEHWKLRALLPAIRAEAALAAGRYLEAMNWSLTFFDAALLDNIGQTQGTVNDRHKTIDYQRNPPDPRLLESPPRARPCLNLRHGHVYSYDTGGRNNGIWATVINRPGLAGLNHELQRGDLGRRLAEYRNLNAHSGMTEAELHEAIQRFTSQGVWHGGDIPPGQRFIGNALIKPIFAELGFADADRCYAGLVRDLTRKLETYKIR
jgi:hypothetical protein